MSDEIVSKLLRGEAVLPHTPELALEEVTQVNVNGVAVMHVREGCPICKQLMEDATKAAERDVQGGANG